MRFAIVLVTCLAACTTGTGSSGGNTGGGNTGGGNTGGGDGTGNGSGGGGGGGGGGGSMTATQFLQQMDQKYCDEAFTCMSTFPATTQTGTFADNFGGSSAQCQSDSATYDMPSVVESEITAGKIHYDGTAAAACVAGIAFGACADFWTNGPTEPAACDTAMVGTVADGAACVVDFDCSNVDSICTTAHVCGADTTARRASFGALSLPIALRTAE